MQRLVLGLVLGALLAGCTQPVPCEGDGCRPAGDAASTSSAPSGRPDEGSVSCTAASPCPLPDVDEDAWVFLVVNATYVAGETVHIRLRNDGEANLTYSTSQASCELGIYDAHGRRLPMGVCSDAFFFAELAPGQEAEYWRWRLTECRGTGPWYGGCDDPQPVPPGTYHLRQTFCASTDCTRAGASLRLAAPGS